MKLNVLNWFRNGPRSIKALCAAALGFEGHYSNRSLQLHVISGYKISQLIHKYLYVSKL